MLWCEHVKHSASPSCLPQLTYHCTNLYIIHITAVSVLPLPRYPAYLRAWDTPGESDYVCLLVFIVTEKGVALGERGVLDKTLSASFIVKPHLVLFYHPYTYSQYHTTPYTIPYTLTMTYLSMYVSATFWSYMYTHIYTYTYICVHIYKYTHMYTQGG